MRYIASMNESFRNKKREQIEAEIARKQKELENLDNPAEAPVIELKSYTDAKPVLCEGLECPDCGGCMEQNDTTYSNINTSRARRGQHTGNIYFCETCKNHWLENFLNNSKLERWAV